MLINPEIWQNPSQWSDTESGYYTSLNSHNFKSLNLVFKVDVTCKSLLPSPYNSYQQFLLDTIMGLKSDGLNFKQISDWLRERKYKTPRGSIFQQKYVWSIYIKGKNRLDKLNETPTLKYYDFDIEVNKV